MKKHLIILGLFLITLSMRSIAQVNEGINEGSTLGIRFGGSDGVEAEVSYEQPVSPQTRLEFDLGFINAPDFNGFKFTLQYQWLFAIGSGFNWYVGAGGSIGAWNLDEGFPGDNDGRDDGVFLDAVGQLGIEYNCNVPLQFSLDFRPEFGLVNDDYDSGFGLGIRYRF